MKRRNKISSEQKLQILENLSVSGSSVGQLAKLHGISRSVLYKWARTHKAINGIAKQVVNFKDNFVELSVDQTLDMPTMVAQDLSLASSNKTELQKASLVFSNFSILLEGVISSKKLISIIKTLEE